MTASTRSLKPHLNPTSSKSKHSPSTSSQYGVDEAPGTGPGRILTFSPQGTVSLHVCTHETRETGYLPQRSTHTMVVQAQDDRYRDPGSHKRDRRVTGVTGPSQFWNPAGDMSDFLNYVSGSRTWPSLQALGSVLWVRLSFSWNIHMFAAECFYWIVSCHYDFGVPTSSFYVVSLTLSVQADRVSADMFFSRTLWIFLEIHWVLLS